MLLLDEYDLLQNMCRYYHCFLVNFLAVTGRLRKFLNHSDAPLADDFTSENFLLYVFFCKVGESILFSKDSHII